MAVWRLVALQCCGYLWAAHVAECSSYVRPGDFIVNFSNTSRTLPTESRLTILSPSGSVVGSLTYPRIEGGGNSSQGTYVDGGNIGETSISSDGKYAFTLFNVASTITLTRVYVIRLTRNQPKIIQAVQLPGNCSVVYSAIAAAASSVSGTYDIYVRRGCYDECVFTYRAQIDILKYRINLSSGKLTAVGKPISVIKSKKCVNNSGPDIKLQLINGKPYGLVSEYRKAPKLLRLGSSSVLATSSSPNVTLGSYAIASTSSFYGLCYPPPYTRRELYYVKGSKTTEATIPKGFKWEGNIAPEPESRSMWLFGSYKGVFKLYKISESELGKRRKAVFTLDPKLLYTPKVISPDPITGLSNVPLVSIGQLLTIPFGASP